MALRGHSDSIRLFSRSLYGGSSCRTSGTTLGLPWFACYSARRSFPTRYVAAGLPTVWEPEHRRFAVSADAEQFQQFSPVVFDAIFDSE